MKKWAFYFCIVLLTACAKDEPVLQTQPEDNTGNQVTSLVVNVNYADCSTGACIGVPIENASVLLFKDDSNLGTAHAIAALQTNDNGAAVFTNLDQKTHHIVVECEYGGTAQQVDTPIGERTRILIEFE